MEKNTLIVTMIGYFILIGLLFITNFYYSDQVKNLRQDNQLLLAIQIVDLRLAEAFVDATMAEEYYLLAGSDYIASDYKGVKSNCKIARQYYLSANNQYGDIKAELIATEVKDPLIDIYVTLLELRGESFLNLYEACEHYEIAAGYYDIYYNTNVPYDDGSYEMGNKAIEMMNEKIDAHDKNVREFNNLLSKFQVELRKRFQNGIA